ncbi:MAG: anti-sigma factor [Bellilinea sp.]
MIQQHLIDELPAYALDCLEESERHAVERHLAVCAECRTEVTALQDAAANLALSVAQVEPAPQLKSAILARIATVRTPTRSMNWGDWLRNLQPAWGVAALAVIVLLVVSNLILWNQVRTLAQNTPVPSFQVVSLAGTGPADTAHGVMIVTDNGRFGTLVVDALPELEKEQQYQLWLILDGQRTSGGVFSVDSWGYGALVIRAPLPLDAYSDFGVTVEPAGGSSAPTGDKVLGGSF